MTTASTLGFLTGTRRQRLRVLLVDPQCQRRESLRCWLDEQYSVYTAADSEQALSIAADVVPSVLIADAGTPHVDCLVERLLEELAIFEIGVILVMDPDVPMPSRWRHYTVQRRPFSREQLLESLARASAPARASAAELRREQLLREEAETLLSLALDLTSRHELGDLLQRATDAATQLTGAAYGAFFYNSVDERGQNYLLYTLSGAPMSAFEGLGAPRNTPLFAPTFAGERIVRCDDVLAESLYGRMSPHHGMPKGHLPIRSYLAVPVKSRTEVLGGLFFGHPEPGMFSQRSERVAAGIAAQAAIAIENSRLFEAMRHEAQRREELEQQLRRHADVDDSVRKHPMHDGHALNDH